MTERRPLYMAPFLAVPTSLTQPVARVLTQALRRIEESDHASASGGVCLRPRPAEDCP